MAEEFLTISCVSSHRHLACTKLSHPKHDAKQEELPSLDTVPFARGALRPHPSCLIKAILVVPTGDLDLKMWSAVVDAEKPTTATTT
jgi:hypothetical protein